MPIRRRPSASFILAGLAVLFSISSVHSVASVVDWQPWSDAAFRQATAEHRLVLLDLEAGWCHWCHVMDGTTYSDPKVIALIRDKYIALRVDQDARPDLANRYENYGWPATVIFKWDGSELAKRRGYIPPRPMASMLQAFADDPTPGPSVEQEPPIAPAAAGALTPAQLAAMQKIFREAYDSRLGGWGGALRFLDWDALEYSLTSGAAGDTHMQSMARQTLTAGLALIDPVWGGVDQYSTNGDWSHPHFEKIVPFQANSIRIFSLAASLWRDPRWLAPAQQIHHYLQTFLTSPDGAFYTSQDADPKPGGNAPAYFALDDAARRNQGIPRVDRHIYSSTNGLVITALCSLYAASADPTALAEARRAAAWIISNRSLPGGGFRHDCRDAAGPYLADTLEMGRAFLALYTVTADRPWLARAESAAGFIDKNFRASAGFATAAPGSAPAPRPETDENVTLARLANMLARCTGNPAYTDIADHAMRYLASNTVIASQGYSVAGILLANRELTTDPTHITIVGAKTDPGARALYAAALQHAPPYTRLEWYDPGEGPLPRADLQYPALPHPAAFLCSNSACSTPVTTPEALSENLARLH